MKNHAKPQLGYLHHISLPCRDLVEAKRFYIDVMGGQLFHDTPGFAEVKIADMIVGVSEQPSGWTGIADEYPHYGFNVDGDNFALSRAWLDGCGVPNWGWTRNYKTALRYFRDPSGNLIEYYCDSGFGEIKNLHLGPRQGGLPLPLADLNYRWSGQVASAPARRPAIDSFGHLSMPVHDLALAKKFFVEVLGGEPMVTSDPATFTEVRLAGATVGLSARGGQWTGGRYVPSLLAAIGEVIERHLIATGFMTKQELGEHDAQRAAMAVAGAEGAPVRRCPRCSAAGLARIEGCDTCVSCGYSKCA